MYGARGGWNIKSMDLKFLLVTPDIKCNGKKVSANSVSYFLDFWPPLLYGGEEGKPKQQNQTQSQPN